MAPALRNKSDRLFSADAFGLLELLIAVAIIVILAALLAGQWGRIVEQANRARCAQNLRQMYSGFIAYAADYEGKFPFGARAPDITDINANYYGGIYGKEFKAYIPGKQAPGINTGYVEPYLCPSDREIRAGHSYGFLGHSYGVNMTICRDSFNRISTWRYPARVFLLTDSLSAVISRSSPSANLAPRHSGGANTLFLDGHVEWIKAPFPNWTENRAFWVPNYEP